MVFIIGKGLSWVVLKEENTLWKLVVLWMIYELPLAVTSRKHEIKAGY